MNNSERKAFSAALAEHVRLHAADYYPDLAGKPFEVRPGKVRRRRFADLCRLEIRTADRRERILAKVSRPADGHAAPVPRVSSRFLETPDAPGSEYRALTAFANRIAAVGDGRFFAVRVLDRILDDRGLLLEFAEADSPARSLPGVSRPAILRRGRGRKLSGLLESLHRTGACLRVFHEMPPGKGRARRGTMKEEFLEWVAAVEPPVANHPFSRDFFGRACPRIRRLAERILPDALPSGPVHDDFAPRNVLVNRRGQVALIDMLDEWTGCVWEDVGHFLFSLSGNKAQALSGGLCFDPAVIERLRGAFLAGYFADSPIPLEEILLYESQTALNAWAAQWRRAEAVRGWRGAVRRWRWAASVRWYARQVESHLDRIEARVGSMRGKSEPAVRAGEGAAV